MVGVGTLLGTQGLAASLTMAASAASISDAMLTALTADTVTTRPKVAIICTGQMWRGPQYPQVIREVDHWLQGNGFGRLHAVLGSSVGSVAVLLAGLNQSVGEEEYISDRRINELWHQYLTDTRLGWRWLIHFPPFKWALLRILETIDSLNNKQGMETVRQSPIQLTMVSGTADWKHLRTALRQATSLLGRGLVQFFSPHPEQHDETIAAHAEGMRAAAHAVFTPHYFVNHDRPIEASKLPAEDVDRVRPEQVQRLQTAEEVLQATRASVNIPVLFSFPWPTRYFEIFRQRFIDGVWAQGTPVEMALLSGATHVYILNDGSAPVARSRETQYLMFVRPTYKTCRFLAWASGWMKPIPFLNRIPKTLARMAGFLRDRAGPPIDTQALTRAYPGTTVEVVGCPATFPKVGKNIERFLLWSHRKADRALATARDQARDIVTRLATSLSYKNPADEIKALKARRQTIALGHTDIATQREKDQRIAEIDARIAALQRREA